MQKGEFTYTDIGTSAEEIVELKIFNAKVAALIKMNRFRAGDFSHDVDVLHMIENDLHFAGLTLEDLDLADSELFALREQKH